MAQMGKNLPAKQKSSVWSLWWENPLKEGMETHSSIFAWRIPMDRGPLRAVVHGSQIARDDWTTKNTHHKETGSVLSSYKQWFVLITTLTNRISKKEKRLCEEALQKPEKRSELKGKAEKERYTQLNAEFHTIPKSDKKAFLVITAKK